MALESGVYAPKKEVRVTVWPKPDTNGDGEVVYQDHVDHEGNFLGRDAVVTDNGDEVKHYLPPDGFGSIHTRDPGSDGESEVYVRVNGRGSPVRNRHGHAVGIREGSALLEYPDGTHELLTDDYSQKLFADAHEKVE